MFFLLNAWSQIIGKKPAKTNQKKQTAATCGWMVDEVVSRAFLVVYTKCFKLCRALVFCEVMCPGCAVKPWGSVAAPVWWAKGMEMNVDLRNKTQFGFFFICSFSETQFAPVSNLANVGINPRV